MRILIAALLMIGVSTAAGAQSAAPDLKGTWTGKFRSVVYGNNSHHPGPQAVLDPPRVREIEFSVRDHRRGRRRLLGQFLVRSRRQGAVRLGAFSPDGKSILGLDTDGMISGHRDLAG